MTRTHTRGDTLKQQQRLLAKLNVSSWMLFYQSVFPWVIELARVIFSTLLFFLIAANDHVKVSEITFLRYRLIYYPPCV